MKGNLPLVMYMKKMLITGGQRLFKILFHYAHALEVRFFQLHELFLLQADGVKLGCGFIWRIMRRPSETEDWISVVRFVKPHESVTLIDVGANVGSFTREFLSIYPRGQAVCFEPVQSTLDQLNANVSGEPRVQTHRCVISDVNGSAMIRVDERSFLSSLCDYRAEVHKVYGNSTTRYTEEAPSRTLDSFDFRKATERLLVKIDVQGSELEVLRGACNLLALADVVHLECSLGEEWVQKEPSFACCCGLLRDSGLLPIVFMDFGRTRSNYAFERNVLFVRRELLGNIWWEAAAESAPPGLAGPVVSGSVQD
jgi:FkbM family methyltransferase